MAKGLPKNIIKKYGISKKAWEVYRGRKVNKRGTTKRKIVGVKKMAKRRRRYTPKRYRRKKAKIPLEIIAAGIAIPFTPAESGWESPLAYAQRQDMEGLAASLGSGFIGLEGGRTPTGINIMKLLNPFDLSSARYTKMLIWAGIASKIRKKLVRVPFDKVPVIGKYIS